MSRPATARRHTPTTYKTHAQMHTHAHTTVPLTSRQAWPSLWWAARYLHYRIGLGRNGPIASERSMYN